MNKYNNHESKLVDIYNRTYHAYLSKINPNIFLHTFINEIVDILRANNGVVIKYDHVTNNFGQNINTSHDHIQSNLYPCINQNQYNDINQMNDLWSRYSNHIKHNGMVSDIACPLMQCIKNKKVIFRYDYTIDHILGIEIPDNYPSDSKKTELKDLLMFVPFVFGSHPNGIMVVHWSLFDRFDYNEIEMLKHLYESFGAMMGVMFNNITITITSTQENNEHADPINDPINVQLNNDIESINHSIIYQLVHAALNIIADIIVITDRDMKIIYKNDNFCAMIKNRYDKNTDEIPMYLYDIMPQTLSLVKDDYHQSNSFYHNKRMEIEQKDSVLEIYVNSIVSCSETYHVLRFIDDDYSYDDNYCIKKLYNKSKNLIAYMSHELRNPIQAISTGVYLINRIVKKISIKSSKKSTNYDNLGNDPENPMITKRVNSRSYINYDDSECDSLTPDCSNFVDNHPITLSCSSMEISDSISSIDSLDIANLSELSAELVDSVVLNDPNNQQSLKPSHRYDDCLDWNEISTLRHIVKRVYGACKNMNIIIDDILDLSKIDNNELIMNLEEHSLREITDLIIDESRSEIEKKGLRLEYEFDTNNPESIYTDTTRTFQILSNLLSNSIKYSCTGTIKFKVTYNVDSNAIMFQVIDQGQGIRKEEIPNLFKQFGRTSNSVTDINSTGLGLCVCQKIAVLLGGSIQVSSEYKKGSMFTFIHPIKLGYSGFDTVHEPYLNKEIKGNVMIVDDDPNITSLFKLLLKCMNYDNGYDLNIETAETGDKAIELTKIKKYDLIFMDIDLDGEDGCTVSERILSNYAMNNTVCPIIAVTANIKSVQHDRDPKYDCFADVVLKPFNNYDINKIIVKYLVK
jgi:signal transduction histidine kinase/CheY-like chemotaxis protein/PAS domain-containing protein